MYEKKMLTAAAAVMLVAGCSGAGGAGGANGSNEEDMVGTASFALTEVPADVRCVRVTVKGVRTVTRLIDVNPGQNTVFTLDGLPIGNDVFTEEAFATACASVGSESVPT